ncbi:MAG: ABC transporter permease [Chloroflexi bacterium]|nr:ABC transporter permease [Chloroflexota bacterium]
MGRYLLQRLVQSVGVLLGVSIVVFLLIRLVPGDPVSVMLPEAASDEQRAQLRQELGLDRPVPVQYLYFLARAAQGDLGTSLFFSKPAVEILADALPYTLLLAGVALALALSLAIPLGILSAVRRDSIWDFLAMGLAMIGQSVPPFWLGLVLMSVFAVSLGWLPTTGSGGPEHLVLPAVTLGAYLMALTTRLVRSGMLDVLSEDYIRTARMKGLSERVVLGRHALVNLMIPVITVVGLQLGALLGGAVITETVFAWPGVGTVVYRAISSRDYPLIQAAVLMLSVFFVFLNLLVDVLYAYLDPRIQYR